MQLPIVRILLKERALQEVPFRGESLRIGRMKENDVVINNLAVSRFHAVLHRAGDGVELEDLGSENGCYVNGARVRGRVPLAAGDAVRIGKHTLLWQAEDASEPASPPAAHGPSDAWDAAETYYAGVPGGADGDADLPAAVGDAPSDTTASAPTGPPVDATPRPEGADPTPTAERPTQLDPPGPGSAELDLDLEGPELGLGGPDSDLDPEAEGLDLDAADPAPEPYAGPDRSAFAEEAFAADAAETPADDASGESGAVGGAGRESEDALFDFSGADPLPDAPAEAAVDARAASASPTESASALEAPTAVDTPAPAGLVAGRYPGLILQRGGRLERVVAWEDARLAVGVAPDGGLALGGEEKDARALLLRENERFLVRALDPARPPAVNGTTGTEHALEVGDVVSLGEWQLTFVLDHEPVQSEVLAAPAAEAAGEEEDEADTSTSAARGADEAGPAPGFASDAWPSLDDDEAPDSFDAPTREIPVAGGFGGAAEVDLLAGPEPEDDEDKELSVHATAAQAVAAEGAGPRLTPLLLELELRPEDLPSPLRALLDALDGGEVSVPVRLRLRSPRSESGSQ